MVSLHYWSYCADFVPQFVHFFYHVLDLNCDHVISQEDFDGLNARVRHYMEWNINNPHYLTLNEEPMGAKD